MAWFAGGVIAIGRHHGVMGLRTGAKMIMLFSFFAEPLDCQDRYKNKNIFRNREKMAIWGRIGGGARRISGLAEGAKHARIAG